MRGQYEPGSELSADCLSTEQATHSRFHARRSITESRPVLRASSEYILAHHGCIVRCRSVVALSGKGSDPSVNRRRALGFASGLHKAGQLGRVDQRRGGQRLSSPLRQVSEHYSCVLQRQQSGEVLSSSHHAYVIRRPSRLRATAIDQSCPCRDASGGQSAGMVRREEGPVLTMQRIESPWATFSHRSKSPLRTKSGVP